MNQELLRAAQARTSRVAMGASAARGQGASGVIECARESASTLRLAPFAVRDRRTFLRRLDGATRRLQRRLPRKAASWGLARRLLNIFLRDCAYVVYLRRAHGLQAIENLCEVPLDSITAKEIRRHARELPRWPGVKHLTPDTSEQHQEAARVIAKRMGVSRVHLDAYWWGARE